MSTKPGEVQSGAQVLLRIGPDELSRLFSSEALVARTNFSRFWRRETGDRIEAPLLPSPARFGDPPGRLRSPTAWP
jgi:hypothetical protein